MITPRPADQRGETRLPWLDSRHSFSFADYRDPAHVRFGALRVINDDRIAAGGGFGAHSHSDMEIVTYVVEGAVAHQDSLGTRETIAAGEVQAMSAGRGITHSEFNASASDPLRLLQIWILPASDGLAPAYEQRAFDEDEKADRLCLIAAPADSDDADGALPIHQDARIYAARLGAGATLDHILAPARRAWVQVVTGALSLNGTELGEGDGAAIEDEQRLAFASESGAEFLLFDLA